MFHYFSGNSFKLLFSHFPCIHQLQFCIILLQTNTKPHLNTIKYSKDNFEFLFIMVKAIFM